MEKVSEKLYQEIITHSCGACKFYKQEKNCCVCSHPEATESEKNYRYYSFTCDSKYKYERK